MGAFCKLYTRFDVFVTPPQWICYVLSSWRMDACMQQAGRMPLRGSSATTFVPTRGLRWRTWSFGVVTISAMGITNIDPNTLSKSVDEKGN
jgi:hypothetical protein